MLIRVQRGSSVPVSRQIDAQVRSQILSGGLPPGQQLPSVRELASELAVNVNTVVRVYERLAADGLVEMRQGAGTFVTYAPRGAAGRASGFADECREVSQEFDALVRRGLLLGLPESLFPKLLRESLARVRKDIASGDDSADPSDNAVASSPRKKGAT
jgi:GntR family transcriptional regulator